MRTRTTLLAIAFAVAGLAPAGCDWRDFDKLKETTPVAAVSAPSGYPTSQDFGNVLLATAPPADGTAAARFVVSAMLQTGIAVMHLDSQGRASGTTVTSTALDVLGGSPVTALAEVKSARQALLGAVNPLGGGDILLMDLDPPYDTTPFFTSIEQQFGIAVAAGTLGGGPADDLVALSGNALHVFVDGLSTGPNLYYADSGAADPCPIALLETLPDRIRLKRAVVVGKLLAGGQTQIAVGTVVATGQGAVSIFDVDTTTGKATCALKLSPSGAGENRFGQALAIGDFDGDGISDLLVGAPPTHAYLFRGPVTTTPTMVLTGASSTGYGAALAAMNIDGKPGDEAFVADPEASVNGKSLAGNVSILKGATLGTSVAPTPSTSVLADRNAGEGESYGVSIAALPFCGSVTAGADGGAGAACTITPLPLVGAPSKVFAYYTIGAVDPRAK